MAELRFRLDGAVALVTGGGRGIGRASALGLAATGADVAVVSRTEAELAAAAREIRALGRRALAIRADLTGGVAVQEVVRRCRDELGALDVLVNSAGSFQHWSL